MTQYLVVVLLYLVTSQDDTHQFTDFLHWCSMGINTHHSTAGLKGPSYGVMPHFKTKITHTEICILLMAHHLLTEVVVRFEACILFMAKNGTTGTEVDIRTSVQQ